MGTEQALAVRTEQTWTEDQQRIIREQFADGCTDDELVVLLYQAKRRGLDPLLGQIRGIKRWNASKGRAVMAVQTSIDAFRLIADRTGKYGGGPAPEFRFEEDSKGECDMVCRFTTRKLCGSSEAGWTWLDVTDEARFKEYCGRDRNGRLTSMWRDKPHVMLSKCAESKTLRRAHPEDLGHLFTDDEMQQADNPSSSSVQVEPKPPDELQCIMAEQDGTRCVEYAVKGSNFCERHTPDLPLCTMPDCIANAEKGSRRCKKHGAGQPEPIQPDAPDDVHTRRIDEAARDASAQLSAAAEAGKQKPEPIETTFHTPDKHQSQRFKLALQHDPKLGQKAKLSWVKRGGACADARAFDRLCLELEKAVGLDPARGRDGLPE